jgi:hypothetical protein
MRRASKESLALSQVETRVIHFGTFLALPHTVVLVEGMP